MGGAGYGVSNITSMAQFTLGAIIILSALCFFFHFYLTYKMIFTDFRDGKSNRSAALKRLIIPLVIAIVIGIIVPIAVVGTSSDLQMDLLNTGVTEFVRFPWNNIIPAQGWYTEVETIQIKAWMVTLLLDAFLGFLFFWISGGIFFVATKIMRR
jgi:hypothetical protein